MSCSGIVGVIADLGLGIGTGLLGLSAIWALFSGREAYEKAQISIAERSLKLQKDVEQRKFQFDVAIEAVDLFNRFRTDMNNIRSPVTMTGELEKLNDLPEENDFVRKMKNHTDAGVVFLRMDQRSETLAAINRLRPKFKAVFGLDEPFDDVVWAQHQVWLAAQMLLQGTYKIESKSFHDDIWKTSEDDEISTRVSNAVTSIEDLCVPVIRVSGP